MFGEKAYLLIKELDRNRDTLPTYNTDLVNEVTNEVTQLVAENLVDAKTVEDSRIIDTLPAMTTMKVRHAAIRRNLRCLLAYNYNRMKCLKSMRWQFGSILPPEVKSNLSAAEVEWFGKYSSALMYYMRSLGEDGGVNLAGNLKPPKSVCIEVRCAMDYGQLELNDGSVLVLKKNSRHYLPRNECEELVRQGILEHVV